MAQRVEVLTPVERLPYPVRQHDRGKWRLGRLSQVLLLIALLGGGGVAYATTHPQETREAKLYIQSLIDQFHASQIPSQGEIFNPNARSGEITSLNTIALPTPEALAKAGQQSTEHGKIVMVLPFNPGEASIKYDIGSNALKDPNYIKLTGVQKGAVFYSPFAGELSWNRDKNNHMAIWIKELNLPWVSPDRTKEGKPFVTFQGIDFSLLFPEGSFNTTTQPNGQIFSSRIRVEAGQPIFAVNSEELLNVFGEMFQIGISGRIPVPNAMGNPASISLLEEKNRLVSLAPH